MDLGYHVRVMKYFGLFKNRKDVAHRFDAGKEGQDWWQTPAESFIPADDFPTDDEILFATYDPDGYEGKAFVLFEREGQLYEVNGAHCSCYGLEGQWKPEATLWGALEMRNRETISDDGLVALGALISARRGK